MLQLCDTFTEQCHPQVIALTGGEPLLRPALVADIARRAHAHGTAVHLLTGMYFARGATVPPSIQRALAAVDHVSASIDEFHEREVPRHQVFGVLRDLIDAGTDVSLQIVGRDDDDPYVAQLVDEVRALFGEAVPMLVSGLHAEGRARVWLGETARPAPDPDLVTATPEPCGMAAWPVLCADGRVTACCNQAVVDGRGPPHLDLGHTATDTWADLSERCRRDPVLQAVRSLGPTCVASQVGVPSCDGYCATCHRLADHPALPEAVATTYRPGLLTAMDDMAADVQRHAGAAGFAARFGTRPYADLVALGDPR